MLFLQLKMHVSIHTMKYIGLFKDRHFLIYLLAYAVITSESKYTCATDNSVRSTSFKFQSVLVTSKLFI